MVQRVRVLHTHDPTKAVIQLSRIIHWASDSWLTPCLFVSVAPLVFFIGWMHPPLNACTRALASLSSEAFNSHHMCTRTVMLASKNNWHDVHSGSGDLLDMGGISQCLLAYLRHATQLACRVCTC